MAFFTWDKRNDSQSLDLPPMAMFGDEQAILLPEQGSLSTAAIGSRTASIAATSATKPQSSIIKRPHSKSRPRTMALPTQSSQYWLVKRLCDLSISILLLPLLGLMLVMIGIIVALTSGFPVFYRQNRLGQHGKTFRIFKFRTMRNNADQALAEWLLHHPELRKEWQRTHKLKRDPRITKLGRFLRDTSLDEIPQIINVLRGEMSLVGPRPIVQAERAKYGNRYVYYSAAIPGVTGVWQVSGRCNVSYEDRVRLDEDYVRNWSLMRDFVILLRTPRSVIRRDGAC